MTDARDDTKTRPTGRRRRRSRVVGVCAVVAAFVLVAAGGLAAFLVRITTQPADLSFMAADIGRGIAAALGPGHTVTLGSVDLEWVEGVPRVRATALQITRADGAVVATIERAYVGLSVAALVTGRFEPVSLEARRPIVGLTIRTEGVLAAGGPDPQPGELRPAPVLALIDPDVLSRTLRALPAGDENAGASLYRIVLDDVLVTVHDERSGVTRTFDRFGVTFTRAAEDALSAAITAQGRVGPWRLSADIGARRAQGRDLRIALSGLTLGELADGDAGPFTATVIAGELTGRIGPDGRTERLDGRASISGSAALEALQLTEGLAPARLAFAVFPPTRAIEIAPSAVRVAGAGGDLSGRIVLPAPGDPTRPVRFDLLLDAIEVDAGGGRVPEVSRVSASGAFEIASKTLWVDRLEAGGERPLAAGRATLRFTSGTPAVLLEIAGGGVSADSAKRLWPAFLVPEAQEWFVQNVVSGRLEEARVMFSVPPGHLDGRPLARENFTALWRVRDASVRLTPELPPVTNLAADIRSTGVSIVAEATNGRLDVPVGRIEMPTITYSAEDMHLDEAVGVLDIRAQGAAGALLDFAARSGMQLGPGIDLSTISGEGQATIRARIPLYPEEDQPPQVALSVEAELRNLAGRGIFEGRDLERGTLRLRAQDGGFTAEGTATVERVQVRIGARQEPGSRRVQMRAELDTDDAIRQRFGIDLAPMVTGPAVVRLLRDTTGTTEGPRRLEVDLTAARVQIPQAAFDKARGVPASASMTLRGQPRVTGLDDFVFQGRGFAVRGRIRLGEDGQPSLMDFTEMRLRPEEQLAVRFERDGNRTALRVTGRQLDARPYLQRLLSDDDSDVPAGRFELSVRVDRAVGQNGVVLSDLRLDTVRQGARIAEFTVAGSFGGATRLSGEILQDRGRPYMFLTSTDAGAVLRFVDLYRHMRGGRFTLTQTLTDPSGRRADGVIFIEDFRVVNDRALERLFGAAPVQEEGLPRRPQPSDVTFERMRVVFARAPGDLRLSDGVLRNQLVGMTFEGRLDWRRQTANLTGTFIPAYGLNNFFARIPVVGAFMGGQNEGLIGVTYAVRGPLSNPTLQINPASAIAPGFLRRIFDFQNQSGAPTPQQQGEGSPTR